MDITVKDLKTRMDAGDKDFILVDVREPHEHAEFNIGGLLIPMGTIADSLSHLGHDKNAEIVVYCRSGNRSGMIKGFLEAQNFTNVRNLIGGMLAWSDMG